MTTQAADFGRVAVLMGGLMIQGVMPGAGMFMNHGDVVQGIFATFLIGGLLLRKDLLKALLGSTLKLEDEGWRKMTIRWIGFFFFVAFLNEVLRRRLSTDDWLIFRTGGVLGLTFVFTIDGI